MLLFVGLGAFGAFGAQFVFSVFSMWSTGNIAPINKTPCLFCSIQILMAVLGALMVWMHIDAGAGLTNFLALNIGVTAPSILNGLSRSTNPPRNHNID